VYIVEHQVFTVKGQQALEYRWLMCGLLGISACHLSISRVDTTTAGTLCAQANRFATSFLEERRSSKPISPVEDTELRKVVDRVECVLQFALWTLHDIAPPCSSGAAHVVPYSPNSCISSLRDLDTTNTRSVSQEIIFAQAKSVLDHETSTFHDPSGAGHALLDRLRI
jgi:hypothetical protein